MKKVFLLGATGRSGSKILAEAVARKHSVTCFVRDAKKLSADLPPSVKIISGDVQDEQLLVESMKGHDVVINAAGYVTNEDFVDLVAHVTKCTEKALGAGGRFIFFGGAAALDVPHFGGEIQGVDLPLVPSFYEKHRINWRNVSQTSLDWSMICPAPMTDGPRHETVHLAADTWAGTLPYWFWPRQLVPLVMKMRVSGEWAVSYEDVAVVIMDNLERNGQFSKKRIGLSFE